MKLTELPGFLAQDWPGSTWLITNTMTIAQFPFPVAYVPKWMVPAAPDLLDMSKPWVRPHVGATHLLFKDLHLPDLTRMEKGRMIMIEAKPGYDMGLWKDFKTVPPPSSIEEILTKLTQPYVEQIFALIEQREARA